MKEIEILIIIGKLLKDLEQAQAFTLGQYASLANDLGLKTFLTLQGLAIPLIMFCVSFGALSFVKERAIAGIGLFASALVIGILGFGKNYTQYAFSVYENKVKGQEIVQEEASFWKAIQTSTWEKEKMKVKELMSSSHLALLPEREYRVIELCRQKEQMAIETQDCLKVLIAK